MIIKRVTITNFRNYLGENTFNFDTNGEKNIVLIGGRNGAGKTSLADSIRLCLYGRKYGGTVVSEASYQNYLSEICSKKCDSFSVEMLISMDEENPPVEMRVRRSFNRLSNTFYEDLTLNKGESKIEIVDESYWSYYIEKLISPLVSRYFFFDGEKVKDVIASSESMDYMRNAINDITGVTELDHLKSDLKEVRRRIIQRSNDKHVIENIRQMRSVIDEINEKIEEYRNDVDFHTNAKNGHAVKKNELEQERSRIIGSTEEKRNELNNRIAAAQHEYDDYNQTVLDFSANRLMYYLASEALTRTIGRAKDENSSILYRYYVDSLKSIIANDAIRKKTGVGKNEYESVINGILEELNSSNQTIGAPILDVPLSKMGLIESAKVSDYDIHEYVESFKNREYYRQEVGKYKEQLQKITNAEVEEIDRLITEKTVDIEIEESKLSDCQGHIEELEFDIKRLESEIRKEERLVMMNDIDKTSVDTIDAVFEAIDERIKSILKKTRIVLSDHVNSMYHTLKNTKDMVKKVVIRDDYTIELFDYNDESVNIKYISEGEKSIVMYSLMYGLHELSTMKFPFIIDSPLGRMDSIHVHNLVSKLYSTMSGQVILLSHDREIIGDNYGLIRPHISKEYLITKNGIPKITEGYFEG